MSHTGGFRLVVLSGELGKFEKVPRSDSDWSLMGRDDWTVRYNTPEPDVFRVGDTVFAVAPLRASDEYLTDGRLA